MEIIVAMTDNYVIGANGDMPWHLPADLQHFKEITSGGAIIMGRRTWESIGRPLPNRLNIVITRKTNYEAIGATVASSIDEGIKVAKNIRTFIIGGGEIYRAVLPLAKKLHITRIHATIDGDTYFPEIDESSWQLTDSVDRPSDTNNCYDLAFETWRRVP